jgi:RHS repeat-associated protein
MSTATGSRYATQADSATGYTTVNDYNGTGDTVAWSTTNGSWTANVNGLDGDLDAEVTQSGTVTLELADLHGDIMATVNPSSDSAPSATYAYTEFGTAEAGPSTPGTYGYLGADGIAGSGLGDNLLMGARGYNSALGRFDSTDPVFEGSANAYDYGSQNPLTNLDPSGQATWCTTSGCLVFQWGKLAWGMNQTQVRKLLTNEAAPKLASWLAGVVCGVIGLETGPLDLAICAIVKIVMSKVITWAVGKIPININSVWFVLYYGWHTIWGPIGYPYVNWEVQIYK